jgi:hypothetical protein
MCTQPKMAKVEGVSFLLDQSFIPHMGWARNFLIYLGPALKSAKSETCADLEALAARSNLYNGTPIKFLSIRYFSH